MKYRQQGSADFTNVSLPSNSRQYALNNLKVFTVYGIMVAAVNEKGPGPYTPEYNVTTGEKRKLVIQSNSLPTGAFIFFFFALRFVLRLSN